MEQPTPGKQESQLRVAGNRGEAQSQYCSVPLAAGMWVIYRPQVNSARGMLIQLGKVLHVVLEDTTPYFVVVAWSPLMKPAKFGKRINYFGSWLASPIPRTEHEKHSHKKKKIVEGKESYMVDINDALVWPLTLLTGSSELDEESYRIPLEVFHFLLNNCEVDLSLSTVTFSDRGKERRI